MCFGPSFALAQWVFCHGSNPMAVTSRIAGCLPPVMVGGPTINSSSQILVNSTGEPLSAAGPCRVVAWPTGSHCAPVSPRNSDLFFSQAAVWSHMTASESSASHPTWASGKSKFKLMSRPVTSWQERGRRGTRPGNPTPARMLQMSFLLIIYLVLSIPSTNEFTLVA